MTDQCEELPVWAKSLSDCSSGNSPTLLIDLSKAVPPPVVCATTQILTWLSVSELELAGNKKRLVWGSRVEIDDCVVVWHLWWHAVSHSGVQGRKFPNYPKMSTFNLCQAARSNGTTSYRFSLRKCLKNWKKMLKILRDVCFSLADVCVLVEIQFKFMAK